MAGREATKIARVNLLTIEVSSAESRARSATILLAEDDDVLRQSHARILRGEGYVVVVVASGDEAARTFEAGIFDVVVSDVDMRARGGVELLQVIRGRDLDVPVLHLKGGTPVEPDHLKDVVRRAAHASRLARARRQLVPLAGDEARHIADLAVLAARFDVAIAKLYMVYQPIVRWSRRSVVAHEALVRSAEPTLARPDALFDAAERLDRLEDVGQKIRSLCVLPAAAAGAAPQLFINLHARDLADESLYDPRSALAAVASQVVFEITERARLETVSDVVGRIRRLRDLGFRIALDDLGAGYAGLTSFATLEPDFVKLDMSLVRDIDRSTIKQKLVGSMIKVCGDLGVEVVAEGVETFAERNTLIALGCDLLQGRLLGPPMSPAGA